MNRPLAAYLVQPHHIIISGVVATLADIFVDGAHADKAIERAFKAHPKWGSRDRRTFAESVYDITRWWRWLWHVAALPEKDYLNPNAITEERLWRVWSVYWLDRHKELPPWDECRHVRLLRKPSNSDAIDASMPDWLYQRAEQEIGAKWPEMALALNQQADVFLRVNTLKFTKRDLMVKLGSEDISTQQVPDMRDTLRLPIRKNVFPTEAFKNGWFEVQDIASQKIAPFLEVEPGMRVIDACAGAGGKTLHLAALMKNKGRIVAMDVHEWKLKELRKRASRNGADTIETKVIDGPQALKRFHGTADRVLLDVPCTGLGVLRRNPDAKWKLTDKELQRLLTLQAEVLRSHSRMVKPGGKLVYATCSVLPSENERQVRSFLSEFRTEWKLETEFHLQPGQDGGDGFYAARMLRLPADANADAGQPQA